jgi:antitoxin PrlF
MGFAHVVLAQHVARYYNIAVGNTEARVSTTVTIKGQVTLPKRVREAAGIRAGGRVEVRVRAEGGVVIERVESGVDVGDYLRVLEDISRRRPIRGMTTDEIMAMTRGDD